MPTLLELADRGQLHRIARFVRQELSPLDFERAPEALEGRIEELIRQALELAGTPVQETGDRRQETELKKKSEITAEAEKTPSSVNRPRSSGKAAGFKWVAETMASRAHADRNEDRWLVAGEHQLGAVLDGVGGSAAAAEASAWVAERLQKEFADLAASGEQVADWPGALKQLLVELNTQFLAATKSEKGLKGGSTTVALAKIIPHPNPLPKGEGGKRLVFGVIGDSRVSIWHKAGNRYELTALDDQVLRLLLTRPERRPSWLAPLLRKHGLDPTRRVTAEEAARAATRLDGDPDPSAADELTKFLFAERAIVTQVIGAPTVNPHTGLVAVAPGDRVLIASDGIHDNLTEGELIRILAHTALPEVASALVVRAHEVSQSEAVRAKQDDITAVVLEVI